MIRIIVTYFCNGYDDDDANYYDDRFYQLF